MPVVLAGVADGDADCRALAQDLDQVECVGWSEDPLAGLYQDRLSPAFQCPGKLALIDRPALVGQVVMPVVAVARRLADDRDQIAVGGYQYRRPRWSTVPRFQLLDAHRDVFRAQGG